MEDRKYTWLKKNPDKQARLDLFFISNTLNSKVDKIYCQVIELIILIFFVMWYEIKVISVTPTGSLIILYLEIRAI